LDGATGPSTVAARPPARPARRRRPGSPPANQDAVAEFAVHGGNLSELAGSPAALPAGATPAGIVVT